MRKLGLDRVEEAREFSRVPAGGYICKITRVEDTPDKEYLKLEYEIVDGPHEGSSRRMFSACGFWPNFIKSYKEKALPFFKGMVTAVEQSNQGYRWNDDERQLVGKFIGLVLGEEEYMAKDGSIKVRLYVHQIRSGHKIKAGEYEIPQLKVLQSNGYGGGYCAPTESENPGYGCNGDPF